LAVAIYRKRITNHCVGVFQTSFYIRQSLSLIIHISLSLNMQIFLYFMLQLSLYLPFYRFHFLSTCRFHVIFHSADSTVDAMTSCTDVSKDWTAAKMPKFLARFTSTFWEWNALQEAIPRNVNGEGFIL